MELLKTSLSNTFNLCKKNIKLYFIFVTFAAVLNSIVYYFYILNNNILNNFNFLNTTVITLKEVIISILFYSFGIFIHNKLFNINDRKFIDNINLSFNISFSTFLNILLITLLLSFILSLNIDYFISILIIFLIIIYSFSVAYLYTYQIGKILNKKIYSFLDIYKNILEIFLLKEYKLLFSFKYLKYNIQYFFGVVIITIIFLISNIIIVNIFNELSASNNILNFINYLLVYIFAPFISSFNFVSYRYIYDKISEDSKMDK